MSKAQEIIKKLNDITSEDDLKKIIAAVNKRTRQVYDMSDLAAKVMFKKGDSVKFIHKGEEFEGVVSEILRKNIRVNVPIEGNSITYKVPPSLLEKVDAN